MNGRWHREKAREKDVISRFYGTIYRQHPTTYLLGFFDNIQLVKQSKPHASLYFQRGFDLLEKSSQLLFDTSCVNEGAES